MLVRSAGSSTVTQADGLGGGGPSVVLALLLGAIVAVFAAIFVFARRSLRLLADANFGLCSGRTTKDSSRPAVTDWLTETIEDAAGNGH